MKNEVKLTSVNILKDVYLDFKRKTLDTDVTLQKIVNRTLDLYSKDENFRVIVDGHKTLGQRESKY
jgi:hypothetical protein